MKTFNKMIVWGMLIALLFVPSTAHGADLHQDKVIFGGSFTLHAGESLTGDVVVFGGNATIEQGATVNGDVAIFGGTFTTHGTVKGDVVVLGGYAEINQQAVITGDFTALGSNIDRAENAAIQGSIITQSEFPLELSFPSFAGIVSESTPRMNFWATPFLSLSLFSLRIAVWAGLAALASLFLSDQERQVNRTAFTQPVISTLVGMLTAIFLPVVIIALLITILLSPLSLIVILIAIGAWVFGIISLGLAVGQRLTKNLESKIDPALAAGLGTLLVMLILNGFNKIVPCVGVFPKLFVGFWMLGAVLLTRFGLQPYPRGESIPAGDPALDEGESPQTGSNS